MNCGGNAVGCVRSDIRILVATNWGSGSLLPNDRQQVWISRNLGYGLKKDALCLKTCGTLKTLHDFMTITAKYRLVNLSRAQWDLHASLWTISNGERFTNILGTWFTRKKLNSLCSYLLKVLLYSQSFYQLNDRQFILMLKPEFSVIVLRKYASWQF